VPKVVSPLIMQLYYKTCWCGTTVVDSLCVKSDFKLSQDKL